MQLLHFTKYLQLGNIHIKMKLYARKIVGSGGTVRHDNRIEKSSIKSVPSVPRNSVILAQFRGFWHNIMLSMDFEIRKVFEFTTVFSGRENRCAEGGTRTHTEFPPLPPQDSVSTSSTTSAI